MPTSIHLFIFLMLNTLVFAAPLLHAKNHSSDTDSGQSCHDSIGSVFNDCLDPTWQEVTASHDSVKWQVVELNDPRANVIDIEFGAHEGQQFSIEAGALSDPNTPHTWLDLSAFRYGKLVFDVRVLNFSNNINGFEVSLGCGKDCKSAPIDVTPNTLDQWQTVSVGIEDLIAQGLEITQIQTAFEFNPIDGEQEGVHVQLDNIRFEAPIPEPMSLVAL